MVDLKNQIDIGEIKNYYGGVVACKIGDKFYWFVQDCCDPEDMDELEEISESLYSELLKHNEK
jgi:hypothetical protein